MLRFGHFNTLWRAANRFRHFGQSIGLISLVYTFNILLGLVRESLLASTFGATEQLDALLLGIQFVRTVGLQISVAIASVLIPVFVPMVMMNDVDSVIEISLRWLKASLLVLILLSVLVGLFSHPLAKLLGPGFSASGTKTFRWVIVILSPMFIVLGSAGLLKALNDSYKLYVGYPIFLGTMTLGVVVGVLLGESLMGVMGAAIGILVGAVFGLAVQIVILVTKSPLRQAWRSIKDRARFDIVSNSPSMPIWNALLMLGSSTLILLQGMVERAFATHLPSGSVTALSLSLSVLGVPSVLLSAVSSVLLPNLVRRYQSRNLALDRKYGLSAQEYFVVVLFGLTMTIGFWLGGQFIVQLLFGRGRFTAEAVLLTSDVLRLLSLGLLAYILVTLLRQVLLARRMIAQDLLISGIVLLSKVALLAFLVPAFGLMGLAVQNVLTIVFALALYVGLIGYTHKTGLGESRNNALS